MISRTGLALAATCAAVLGGCYMSTGTHPPAPTPDEDAGRPPSVDASTPPAPPTPSDGTFPVAGGTAALTADGRIVAADVATDTLFVFDPTENALLGSVALGERVEPGRVAVDASGRAHVALRRTGEIVSVALDGPSVLERRAVCGAPRGIAVDGASVVVACAGGELVTLPANGGAATSSVFVEPDLRDVLVGDGVFYVSRFRSAELLTVGRDGSILDRRVPPSREATETRRDPALGPMVMAPNVAYRLRFLSDGGVAMLHQRSASSPIDVGSTGYSAGGCAAGVVEAAITIFPADGGAPSAAGALFGAGLAVDFAVSGDGGRLVVARAALPSSDIPFAPPAAAAHYLLGDVTAGGCVPGELFGEEGAAVAVEGLPDGRVGMLHHGSGRLFGVQSLLGGSATFTPRPTPIARDRGYVLFHTETPSGVSCASCHPEGGEDGHVWDFQPTGPRRTQTLLGGLLETAPFHWDGDQPNMDAIMNVTFAERMGGLLEGPADVAAIADYLDRQPLPRGSQGDPAAIARGQALFEGAAGCASCHGGSTLSNGETLDVGTGGAFQVPSLRGVWLRAPFFHDGCASTLSDVIAPGCGGASGHGDAAGLTEAQRGDLIAYLRSL